MTVDQYEFLVEIRFFGDARVEMLDGFVVNKTVHGSLSCKIISILGRLFSRSLSNAVAIRQQMPVQLQRSEPEPDLAVVVGPEDRYDHGPPRPQDILVVMEVADSSLAKDSGIKLRAYARNAIREYWIINCVDRQVEVYTEPTTTDGLPRYAAKAVFRVGETASLRIDGETPIEIPLTTLFGEG